MTASDADPTTTAAEPAGNDSRPRSDGTVARLAAVFLLSLGVPLLAVNERDAVAQLQAAIARRAGIVVVDPAEVRQGHDARLVYLTGPASADTAIADPDTQVQSPGLLLHRHVEVYQWSETLPGTADPRDPGSSGTHPPAYALEWSQAPVASDRFLVEAGHVNPPTTLEDAYLPATDAHVLAYALSPDLLMTLPVDEPVRLEDVALPDIRAALGRPASLDDGGVFVGDDPAHPAPGDLRIRYSRASAGDVTLLAQQAGSTLAPPPLKTGVEFEPIRFGRHALADLIDDIERPADRRIWLLRMSALAAIAAAAAIGRGWVHPLTGRHPRLRPIADRGPAATAIVAGMVLVAATIAGAWWSFAPALAVAIFVCGVFAGLSLASLLPRRR